MSTLIRLRRTTTTILPTLHHTFSTAAITTTTITTTTASKMSSYLLTHDIDSLPNRIHNAPLHDAHRHPHPQPGAPTQQGRKTSPVSRHVRKNSKGAFRHSACAYSAPLGGGPIGGQAVQGDNMKLI
ncbi:hypothetical protein vseg_019797 [Gypsophila vaccaria]